MSEATTTTQRVIEIDPKDISVGWRARKDYGDIGELASSIETLGQVQPIAVRKTKRGYYIISGMRRVRACKKLGCKVKAIVVRGSDEVQRLRMQLEENIKRKGFDQMETGEGLLRLKRVYEREHPETAHGATGGGRAKNGEAQRFTLVAASSLGVSETKVSELLGAAKMSPEEKEFVKEASTPRERNKRVAQVRSEKRKQRRLEKLEQQAEEKRATRAAPTKKATKTVALYKGDCFKLLQKINKASVDVVLTDPPYGRGRIKLATDIGSVDDQKLWDTLDLGWVQLVAPLLVNGGHLMAFCPLEMIGFYELAMRACGIDYRGSLVWQKTNPAPVYSDTTWNVGAVEAIVWGTKGKGYFFKPWKNNGAAETHNLLRGPICGGDERLKHPTQKPEWLIKRLLQRVSARKAVVLDPFCGVGTTLAVCKKTGRIGYGIERSAEYVNQAKIRLQAI